MLLDLDYTSLTREQRPTIMETEVTWRPTQTQADGGQWIYFLLGMPVYSVLSPPPGLVLSHPHRYFSSGESRVGGEPQFCLLLKLGWLFHQRQAAEETRGPFPGMPQTAGKQWVQVTCSR